MPISRLSAICVRCRLHHALRRRNAVASEQLRADVRHADLLCHVERVVRHADLRHALHFRRQYLRLDMNRSAIFDSLAIASSLSEHREPVPLTIDGTRRAPRDIICTLESP
jgi:hypothetical protein